ncbi:ABC transporter ATP-binding protein [Motiliproteus sp. SC1-56]|uniref:ABC transporter transmembrane domain-containing protein n=1 Tax=Motiliproteus sp. SC1-56 TaxID=2799565 RepID=UPI001A8F1850|nr:ABC transporter ATP-binding protein [Motiliproteus sp. SC1-56]
MDSSIFKYILRHTLKDQVLLLLLTVLSLPFLYATLEVPKLIINDAIGGANVPDELFGYPMDQIRYLFVLSLLFLALVLINGGLKYVLNVYRGVVGERMLRRFRFELFTRILRFPLPHFKKVSQGEMIPIITAETEPLGGFIGEAFALPAFQGGVLFTYLFFIFNQDPMLGLVATALYPFQMYIIPKLQRRVNQLGKQRVIAARRLGDRIGDTIAGIREVHAHDTSHFERSVVSERLGSIFELRYEIYKKKFFIKFLNNFLAQVTPFFFYFFGGYYVIQGELSLGALVAVLAAYKDLSAPWKELLKYYQTKEDVRIKYEQIVDQFQPATLMDVPLQDAPPTPLDTAKACWEANKVAYAEHEGINLIDQLSFRIALREHTAIVGMGGSGKEELGLLLARLLVPTGGRLYLAGTDITALSEATLGRHLAHVGANAHLFGGSLRDNLLYGLRHRPQDEPEEEAAAYRAQQLAARQSGNSEARPDGRWYDLEELGLESEAALHERIHRVLALVDLNDDVFAMGLLGYLEPHHPQTLEGQLLEARRRIHNRLQQAEYKGLVELFDWPHYNTNLSVLGNILFGASDNKSLNIERAAGNPQVQRFLEEQGLLEDLLLIGYRLTEIMVDLFSDVEEDSDLFERFSFIRAEDLPDYRALLGRTGKEHLARAPAEVRQKLLALTFQLSPARHRLGLIDEAMQQRILQARFSFAEKLEARQFDFAIEFFDQERFSASLNLQDNMLFGRLVYGQAKAQARITALIHDVVNEVGLEEAIIDVGMDFQVGSAGGRLSLAQRQKLAIARGLLKDPDALILNEATSGMDPGAETRVLGNLREALQGCGLVFITSRVELARGFDRQLLLERGKLVEEGDGETIRQEVVAESPGDPGDASGGQ